MRLPSHLDVQAEVWRSDGQGRTVAPHLFWKTVEEKDQGQRTDYALIVRYFDTDIGKPVVILAGLTDAATNAAITVMAQPEGISTLLHDAPVDWASRNAEVVLTMQVLDGEPASPHVVAAVFW